MQTFSTPMMKQYLEVKKQYQDCLLFYRMGDFYELFLDDAHVGAKVLNITLTSRPKGKDGRIPMAGVPFHAVDVYLAKLVKAGYKVAICEQMSLPNKKGIIDRAVIRVVTPGTQMDEKALNKKENNYIVSVAIEGNTVSMSVADISTGYFSTMEVITNQIEQTIKNELTRLSPAECILSQEMYDNPAVLRMLKSENNLNIFCFQEWGNYMINPQKVLKDHFHIKSLRTFDIADKPLAIKTSAALLGYLQQTQKVPVKHIKKMVTSPAGEYMPLDRSTIMNLELFSTIREHNSRGSLLTVIDETITPMGGRLLKQWIQKPLLKKKDILSRHNAVEELINKDEVRKLLQELFAKVSDIERIMARLSVNIGNAKDLINLKETLKVILSIKSVSARFKSSLLKTITNNISSQLNKVIKLIVTSIVDEPPFELKEGGIIKNGLHKQLDHLRSIETNSKDWMSEFEKKEREKTKIGSLKVRFNSVFGFYIEVSKSNLDAVPSYYDRKQTLVNGERFSTKELKKHEEIILTAQERINIIEYEMFLNVLQKVLNHTEMIQNAAMGIAQLDCIATFSSIAQKNQYVRPTLIDSGEINIVEGRHPVVEKLLETDRQFVPNTVDLNNNQPVFLITGPNMAGKSVLIRQVALIVLMNQIGCFVPATEAHLSIVDRIFVRSGAADAITAGLSTFMVEMVETAYILNNTTKNSLIVMDEIGRGTSTYDGISIAWAIAQYLVTAYSSPPKTLFATHYHELQEMENEYPRKIKNFHMEVQEQNDVPIFLYTLLPGGASHSFGVAVAKLAGVPQEVIEKALTMLAQLEKRSSSPTISQSSSSISTNIFIDQIIHKELSEIDIHHLTPLEALNKLAQLKDQIRMLENKNDPFIEAD